LAGNPFKVLLVFVVILLLCRRFEVGGFGERFVRGSRRKRRERVNRNDTSGNLGEEVIIGSL